MIRVRSLVRVQWASADLTVCNVRSLALSHLLPQHISCRGSGEKLLKYQANPSCVIPSLILLTTLFYKALILQGEIWCWSLLGLVCRTENWLSIFSTILQDKMNSYEQRGHRLLLSSLVLLLLLLLLFNIINNYSHGALNIFVARTSFINLHYSVSY